MKVFLDANVLFAAAYSVTGGSAYLFEIARDFGLELLTCEYAFQEALINLESKAPKRAKILGTLRTKLYFVNTVQSGECPEQLSEKDRPIYLSALTAKSDFLVTLDRKDFGFLFEKKNVACEVLTPATLLTKLRKLIPPF